MRDARDERPELERSADCLAFARLIRAQAGRFR
jgi:hypothetical protein